MHNVVGDVVGTHGLEGACAHVQGDAGRGNALFAQLRQQGFVKMQGCGGGRHGAWVFGKYRLVAARVFLALLLHRRFARVIARNIGRQGHMAVLFHHGIGVIAELQVVQGAVCLRPAPQHCGLKSPVHLQHRAWCRLFAGSQMRGHGIGHGVLVQHALDQQLNLPTAGFVPEQARFDDLRVVEDQQVFWPQQPAQFGKHAIHGLGPRAVEQARAGALRGWLLGNQLGRQVEIKVIQGQGCHGHPTQKAYGKSSSGWHHSAAMERHLFHAPIHTYLPCSFAMECRSCIPVSLPQTPTRPKAKRLCENARNPSIESSV